MDGHVTIVKLKSSLVYRGITEHNYNFLVSYRSTKTKNIGWTKRVKLLRVTSNKQSSETVKKLFFVPRSCPPCTSFSRHTTLCKAIIINFPGTKNFKFNAGVSLHNNNKVFSVWRRRIGFPSGSAPNHFPNAKYCCKRPTNRNNPTASRKCVFVKMRPNDSFWVGFHWTDTLGRMFAQK